MQVIHIQNFITTNKNNIRYQIEICQDLVVWGAWLGAFVVFPWLGVLVVLLSNLHYSVMVSTDTLSSYFNLRCCCRMSQESKTSTDLPYGSLLYGSYAI